MKSHFEAIRKKPAEARVQTLKGIYYQVMAVSTNLEV
jgi:hypothetical protein